MAVSTQSFWGVRRAQASHSDVLGLGGSEKPRPLTVVCLDLGVRGAQASHRDVLGLAGSSVRKSLEKWLADPTMRQPLLFRVWGTY